MSIALAISRLGLGLALMAFLSTLARTGPRGPSPNFGRSTNVMALATLALGLALFALFFGLIAACDRL